MNKQQLHLHAPISRLPESLVNVAVADGARLLTEYGVPDGVYFYIIGPGNIADLPEISRAFLGIVSQIVTNSLVRTVDTLTASVLGVIDGFLLDEPLIDYGSVLDFAHLEADDFPFPL